MRKIPKGGIFVAALAVTAGVSVLIPTPNNVNGGDAKMFFIIFGTVFLKALIEWGWKRMLRR